MNMLVLGLVCGVTLLLFGYKFVRLFAPFVFFVASIVGVFRWAAVFTDSIVASTLFAASVGVLLGILLATFSSLVISVVAVLFSVTVAYRMLDVYILEALGVPKVLATIVTLIVIAVFLFIAVGTYLMRYIGIFVSTVIGTYLVFIVFNELAGIAPSDRLDNAVAGPWLVVACIIMAVLGMIVQIRQHRSNQRPFSERGLWSLQDYNIDQNR